MTPLRAPADTDNGDPAGQPAAVSSLVTLQKRADFLAAAKGRRQATPGFVIQALARNDGSDAVRVGFTCSRKVGNAVARNRAKRRLREIARAVLPKTARPGWDYVLIGRREHTATRDFDVMQSELAAALIKLHGPAP